MAVIALDLGGTKVASAIIDKQGNVKGLHKNMLAGRCGSDVGKLILETIDRQLEKADYYKINIEAIGVCVPGSVDPDTGLVWAPNIPQWESYPLAQELKRHVEGRGIDVYVDNDRSCAIYGELWQGAGRGCKNCVFMVVGTGIGAGIVIDGRVLHGAHDIVGATGWMALQTPFIKEYEPQGCFEYYASGTGICNRAKEMIRADKSYRGELRQMPISRVTTKHIFKAYRSGDVIARSVVGKAVEMWGMAAANFVSLLNPEKVIWGGGVFCSASNLVPAIYDEAKRWAQPLSIRNAKFEATLLNGNEVMLGAAYLALSGGKVDLQAELDA
ncbi:MAG: ROK family protein [Muribaculaceae bacterium]